MSDSLDKYIPEFDENETRSRLAGASAEELTNMLIFSYKLRRVIEKMMQAESNKLKRIEQIIAEPSSLSATPGIPSADDLRRMMGDE
jgi:hypothetical protein